MHSANETFNFHSKRLRTSWRWERGRNLFQGGHFSLTQTFRLKWSSDSGNDRKLSSGKLLSNSREKVLYTSFESLLRTKILVLYRKIRFRNRVSQIQTPNFPITYHFFRFIAFYVCSINVWVLMQLRKEIIKRETDDNHLYEKYEGRFQPFFTRVAEHNNWVYQIRTMCR